MSEFGTLRDVLQQVQPNWTSSVLDKVEKKLAEIKICDVPALSAALKGQLNSRLSDAGLKTFHPDTVRSLRLHLGVRQKRHSGKKKEHPNQNPENEPDGAKTDTLQQSAFDAFASRRKIAESKMSSFDDKFALDDSDDLQKIPTMEEILAALDRAEADASDGRKTSPSFATSREDEVEVSSSETIAAALDRPEADGNDSKKKSSGFLKYLDDEWEVPPLEDILADLDRAEEEQLVKECHSKGIPFESFPFKESAEALLQQYGELDALSTPQMQLECTSLGYLPSSIEAPVSRNEMHHLLKLQALWVALPLEALRKICLERGVPWDDDYNNLPKSRRQHAIKTLTEYECLDFWSARGFPAWQIGDPSKVLRLVEQCTGLESFTIAQLKDMYLQHGLLDDRTMRRNDFLKDLKSIFEWEALPFLELQNLCWQHGMERNSPDIFERKQDDQRLFHLRWLIVGLSEPKFTAKGVPVRRLESLEAATALVTKFEVLDGMSALEIRLDWDARGLPSIEDMSSYTMCENLKLLALWNALSIEELREECRTRCADLTVADPEEMLTLLTLTLLEDIFKKKGIPSNHVRSVKAANELVQLYASYDDLTEERIQEKLAAKQIPTQANASAASLKEMLKKIAYWDYLSINDLQFEATRTCTLSNISTRKEEERRHHLMDALLLPLAAPALQERGIPTDKFQSLEACLKLERQWKQLEQYSLADMRAKYRSWGLTAGLTSMEEKTLRTRLRDVYLWMQLPLVDLQRLCREHNVNSIAHASEQKNLALRLAKVVWDNFAGVRQPPPPGRPQVQAETVPKHAFPKPVHTYQHAFYNKAAPKSFPPKAAAKFIFLPKRPPPPKTNRPQPAPPPKTNRPQPAPPPKTNRPQPPPQQQRNTRTLTTAEVTERNSHLRVLELAPPSNLMEIKKAYRMLALRYHPDKNKDEDATVTFRKIHESYSFLSKHFD